MNDIGCHVFAKLLKDGEKQKKSECQSVQKFERVCKECKNAKKCATVFKVCINKVVFVKVC